VGPARMIVESLTRRPGIREHNREHSDRRRARPIRRDCFDWLGAGPAERSPRHALDRGNRVRVVYVRADLTGPLTTSVLGPKHPKALGPLFCPALSLPAWYSVANPSGRCSAFTISLRVGSQMVSYPA
jgi:hypothetical protein